MSVPVTETAPLFLETATPRRSASLSWSHQNNSDRTFPKAGIPTREIAFLDSRLTDLPTLQAALRADIQVYILHPEVDGITQIDRVLQQSGNIHTLHLFGHGAPGEMQLGQEGLSTVTVAAAASTIAQWPIQAIHLYGCQVGQQPELLDQLHQLTGANIAASRTDLGNGHWQLDLQLGVSETIPAVQGEYSHSLPVFPVDDINPGSGSSNPAGFKEFNSNLYFSADDGTNGSELWKVDAGGTATLVADIDQLTGSNPQGFTLFNNTLYFRAFTFQGGVEIWNVDGSGQVNQVPDINTGSAASSPNGFTVFNNILYFSATDGVGANGRGVELWQIGLNGSPSLVQNINPGTANSNPEGFTVFNNTLYFAADDGTNGTELWKVDSNGNTSLVSNINPGGASNPKNFTLFNNALYFSANDGTTGTELWRLNSNGSASLVSNINATGDANPLGFTVFNNALYFSASNGTDGTELWKVDSNGNLSSQEINVGAGSSTPTGFIEFNGFLYFAANDGTNGNELWQVDSNGNVSRVQDINQGAGSSNPTGFTVFNNNLYFAADDGVHGNELWRINLNGVVSLAQDINLQPQPNGPNGTTDSSNPTGLTVFNDGLYFSANDGQNGTELFRYVEGPGVTIVESQGNTYVTEDNATSTGLTDSYIVVLNTKPTNDVTVTFDLGSSPQVRLLDQQGNPLTQLVFTPNNWKVAQTVTVQAISDGIDEGIRSVSIAHTVSTAGTDYSGVQARSVSVKINDRTNPPTDIQLNNTVSTTPISVDENIANGLVGSFTTADLDSQETFTYTLVPGSSANNNSAFSISGNQLFFKTSPDYEAGPTSYTIHVRSTDSTQLSVERDFTINIKDINDAPVLADTNVSLGVNRVNAGSPVGAVGTLVSQLVGFPNSATGQKNVTDQDAGAKLGIALTAADATNGTWFYSINNGTNWNALGGISASSPLLLAADANTRLYFQPNANFNGSIANAITFRAWDQSLGTNGTIDNTLNNTTALSSASDTASLRIQNTSLDFNGDGNSDILWHNQSSGQTGFWEMNGTTLNKAQVLTQVVPASSGWSPVAVSDFTGDGYADIIWRNSNTGDNGIWQMNGTTLVSAFTITPVAPNSGWDIAGVGDFTGDGNTDILWRNHNTGQNGLWQMNGVSFVTAFTINSVGPSSGWDIAGAGDFTGDGKADILWRNRNTGENGVWQMNSSQFVSAYTIDSVSVASGWQITGVGDYTGDGKADIIWRNGSGQAGIWAMDGNSRTAVYGLSPDVSPSSGWNIVNPNYV